MSIINEIVFYCIFKVNQKYFFYVRGRESERKMWFEFEVACIDDDVFDSESVILFTSKSI